MSPREALEYLTATEIQAEEDEIDGKQERRSDI